MMNALRQKKGHKDTALSQLRVNESWLQTNFPCRSACPVGTNAGGYVSLISQGHDREAYALARGPNPFASVCGRICAHPCEAACRRAHLDDAVSIRALKRFACERHGIESQTPFDEIVKVVEQPRPKAEKPGKVAIIGAGPAGLACAHDLALMGHEVTIYDAAKIAGGMMRMGIPAYRLPRDLLDREIEFVKYLGVTFQLGVEIGNDVLFKNLCEDNDAVFIGAGCRKGRSLNIEGVDNKGVLTAVDFLANANLGVPLEIGKNVVVVGGGNVAFDAARSVRRFGGTSEPDEEHHRLAIDAATMAARTFHRNVTMFALESPQEIPADHEEIEEGAKEGVKIVYRRGPSAILGKDGKVTGFRTIDVTQVFDDQGRFSPKFAEGTEKEMDCDTVILAIGQVADLSFLGTDHGLDISPRSTITVNRETLSTNLNGVYAGGDIAFGPRIVIEAVADGRRAAKAIDTQITGRQDSPSPVHIKIFDTFGYNHPFAQGDYENVPRSRIETSSVHERGTDTQVELNYETPDARMEGSRCLRCWINTVFDSSAMSGSECIQCGGCVDVCPENCIDLISLLRIAKGKVDLPSQFHFLDGSPVLKDSGGAALIKDETACIRCGLCARRCPVSCITMQGFYQENEMRKVQLGEASI